VAIHGALWLALALCVTGCGAVDYRAIDLQLDIVGSLPDTTETLHVCVSEVGELSAGAGNGRVVYAGLPADTATTVTVDFLDASGAVIGGAGPAIFEPSAAWVEQPQDQRQDGCTAQGQTAPDNETGWVLGVRFTEEPW
jgi:hypothetical protein